jgi:transposase
MTKEQVKQAELMRCQNMTWSAIGRHFGVSRMTVRNYVYPEHRKKEYTAHNAKRRREAKRAEHITRIQIEALHTFPIPHDVLADRDRRMAMQPRSLTAALMGDPPASDWHKRA